MVVWEYETIFFMLYQRMEIYCTEIILRWNALQETYRKFSAKQNIKKNSYVVLYLLSNINMWWQIYIYIKWKQRLFKHYPWFYYNIKILLRKLTRGYVFKGYFYLRKCLSIMTFIWYWKVLLMRFSNPTKHHMFKVTSNK